MLELLKSIIVCREATLDPYINIPLNTELCVEGCKEVYCQLSMSRFSPPTFQISLFCSFTLEEILYLLTSNERPQSDGRKVIFPVSVPAVVQKIFEVCLV